MSSNVGLIDAIELHERGEIPLAIDVYRQALELRPDSPETLNNLGIALCESGRDDEGITAFRKAVALAPRDAEIRFNLGTALLRTGDAEAVFELEQALRLDPDDLATLVGLAEAYSAAGRRLGFDSFLAETREDDDDARKRARLIALIDTGRETAKADLAHSLDALERIFTDHKLTSRAHLSTLKDALSRSRDPISLAVIYRFCREEVAFCREWLHTEGESAVANVTQLALYADSLSERLLDEALRCRENVLARFELNVRGGSESRSLEEYLASLMEAPAESGDILEDAWDYFRIHDLNEEIVRRLDDLAERMLEEAVAESAALTLRIVEIRDDAVQFRGVDSQGELPDFTLAAPRHSFGRAVFSLDFLAGVRAALAVFTPDAPAEQRREIVHKAAVQVRAAIEAQANAATRAFTAQAAEAIANSAESALEHLDGGATMISVAATASAVDEHIALLEALWGQPPDSRRRVSYGRTCIARAPRRDTPARAAELFREWFTADSEVLRAKAAPWLAKALAESPMPKALIDDCCRTYLARKGRGAENTIAEIGGARTGKPHLASLISKGKRSWLGAAAHKLGGNSLFNDARNSLVASCPDFMLKGVSAALAEQIAQEFAERCRTIVQTRPLAEYRLAEIDAALRPTVASLGQVLRRGKTRHGFAEAVQIALLRAAYEAWQDALGAIGYDLAAKALAKRSVIKVSWLQLALNGQFDYPASSAPASVRVQKRLSAA